MVDQVLHCFDICPEPVVMQVPENNWSAPGSGGGGGSFTLFTSDTDSIELNGNGTSGNPLSASFVNGQIIEFEISFAAVAPGVTEDQVMLSYVPRKNVTIPAGLPNFGVAIRDQVGDVIVELFKNDDAIGTITIDNGNATAVFPSAVSLAPDDNLRALSGAVSEFSELSITIRALRTLDFVP